MPSVQREEVSTPLIMSSVFYLVFWFLLWTSHLMFLYQASYFLWSEEKYEKNTVNVFTFCAELRVFIPTLNRFCLLSTIKFLMYSIHTYLKTTCIYSYQMEMEFLCLLFSLLSHVRLCSIIVIKVLIDVFEDWQLIFGSVLV